MGMGEEDYMQSKSKIVNTLIGINGSMKEFSEDLEGKLNKYMNSNAGKKYGLSKNQYAAGANRGTLTGVKQTAD